MESAGFAKGINSRAQTGPTGILGFSISRIAEKGAHLITHGCFVVQSLFIDFELSRDVQCIKEPSDLNLRLDPWPQIIKVT
jgi:hypothetical protein